VLHEEATTPLAGVALPVAAPSVEPVESSVEPVESSVEPVETPELLVVVGPEGGISDGELAALTEAGAVAARLGPHVLRTSTAGPVAIALLSERLGRWA
jgi:16S rRNA (uracil1498-N3)-methyltransferase